MFCDTMIQQTWPDNEIVFKLPDVLCLRSWQRGKKRTQLYLWQKV